MGFAVRVEDDYVWLVCRHVSEGEPVVPGTPLLDIVPPGGIQETIFAVGSGVVGHIEGKLLRALAVNDPQMDPGSEENPCSDDCSDLLRTNQGLGSVFRRNDGLCYIVAREQHGTRKSGLHPRPGPSVRMRRELGVGPG